jgi:hypothetical protein
MKCLKQDVLHPGHEGSITILNVVTRDIISYKSVILLTHDQRAPIRGYNISQTIHHNHHQVTCVLR